MYDSLLAERLSVDGQFAKSVTSSTTSTSSFSGTRSNFNTTEGIGRWGSETKNGPTSGSKGLPTMNGGGYAGKRCDWNETVSVSKSTTAETHRAIRGMEPGSSNKSNTNSAPKTLLGVSSGSGTHNLVPLLTRAHWTTTNLLNQQKLLANNGIATNKNLVKGASAISFGMPNGKEKRPLSVNSIVSSTSSSSCCSESSSSLGNPALDNLAPRASPEEEDCVTMPDHVKPNCKPSAKNKIPISNENVVNNAKTTISAVTNSSMENNRCFSNSATKDCGENVTNSNSNMRGRISYPISQTPGKPKYCDPNLSYMDRVVMEIVETERVYVNDLREIISGYLQYWINQPEDHLVLDDIQELFSNTEAIYQFNSEFLTRLEVCGLNPVGVARCFVVKNEGFSIYTQYCTNYPRTMSILTEMMRQEQSAKSFRERQAILGHSLPLGSYLLKPVQRILKYHLLLQNIVKHYEHGMESFETIVEALSAMTNIAHHINDMKRKHEHAVRVQEIQSLLYGWQGEDLTTYGELCAEGTFRAYGAKALRHVFLFDKMVLITKKKEDGILCYKTHIMCLNLMLIESVPGEPLSFHVIPFDNPRLQCTLQARNLEQKREWTLQLKRVILENYSAVIPTHARQLVMELGQIRPEENGSMEKVGTKRQHSAPEYLERRKQEKDRRKSESSLKARLRKGRKSDMMSPKEGFGRRRKNSTDSSRERSESRDSHEREISIDRKMSSASCPPSGSTSNEKKLVKKLSGWRRKSEPGIYESGKSGKRNGLMSPSHGTSNLTLDTESIGEEEGEYLEEEPTSCLEEDERVQVEECQPNVEERRESIEEIVGQLVMQNREFQRILSKQRLVHLRKALTQYQRKQLHEEEESASETETEEQSEKKSASKECKNTSSGSQGSSSNGIGSSSDMVEMSSENISIEANDEVMSSSKNVQRTVSDPGNKATLTPRRFMSGPFAHYDPLSLLWSSFRRNDNRSSKQGVNSPVSKSKGKSIRHTHSFSCSRKEPNHKHHQGAEEDETEKDPLPLPHGDSGVFPNSFTSDSSSSSEANIPTLPAVWLKQQDEHLATPNNKSGSLPRSFQVGQPHTHPVPSTQSELESSNLQATDDMTSLLYKSRLREGKLADRPITIASDKPSTSDVNYDEMEHYMNKFNDQMSRNKSSSSTTAGDDVEDLATELTPMTSMENLSLHPDHKIYRPSKSSIKHMLLSVTHRLSGLKVNMLAGNSASTRENINFGSFSNISATSDSSSTKTSTNQDNGRKMSNGNGLKNLNMLPRNYRKALKQKLKNIVREDRDSDCENCEGITCSSGSSGFGSVGSCESSNNLTSKIGARLAQSSEQSDYALSKMLLGSGLMNDNRRPNSVMSVSSTVTSTSSTDDKASSGFGDSLSGSSTHIPDICREPLEILEGAVQGLYRPNRKAINRKELYLSYIDQDGEAQDSDASADSFYERSFEAIESLLEIDSAIYSAEENASANSSVQGSQYSSSWGLSSSFQDSLDSASSRSPSRRPCFSTTAQLNSISMLAARLSNSRMPSLPLPSNENRRSRLIRSQAILEKLKHLEECSQFHREELPSPSFEGIKSIQERRNELELWKQGRIREDECETSSQHSTSTICTVIELSPSKSTSFPSSRRCSDTESSGGNSPLTERAISRNSMNSSSNGNLVHDPMPKGWVKLLVGKLQATEAEPVTE